MAVTLENSFYSIERRLVSCRPLALQGGGRWHLSPLGDRLEVSTWDTRGLWSRGEIYWRRCTSINKGESKEEARKEEEIKK